MPKKTRREKIIADSRNKLQVVQGNLYQFNEHSSSSIQVTDQPEQTAELAQIKRDLTKTILLAIAAFTTEVSLFWFWKS